MSTARSVALAALAPLLSITADAASLVCPDLQVSVRHGMPAGQLAATVMGPVKQVPAPKHHVAVPDGALDTVDISLERTECYGSCPSYAIELKGDGTASYTGKAFVLVNGHHTFNVRQADVQCLLQHFKQADFWSLADRYVADITDGTQARVTLTIGGKTKTVIDYFGLEAGMPGPVTAIEDEIDRIGANRWVQGTGETLPSLRAEDFDFHSQAAADALAMSAAAAPDDLVLGLVEAGAPLTTQPPGPERRRAGNAVVNASHAGRITIVRTLIAKGAFSSDAPPDVKERALINAAASGNPSVVAEILKYQPNVDATDYEGDTALVRMWDSQRYGADKSKADIVSIAHLLLEARADPNIPNKDGSTALFSASNADVVRALLKAGAKIDVRNKYECTPLLYAESDEAAVALIEAGADINVKSKFENTIQQNATNRKFAKTLRLLQQRNIK